GPVRFSQQFIRFGERRRKRLFRIDMCSCSQGGQSHRQTLIGPSWSKADQLWLFSRKHLPPICVLSLSATPLGRFGAAGWIWVRQSDDLNIFTMIEGNIERVAIVTTACVPENDKATLWPAR